MNADAERSPTPHYGILRWFCVLVVITIQTCTALAQASKSPATTQQLDIITRATENELQALQNPGQFQYQERLEWSWGTETRRVIETPAGRADRVILFHDEPLSPEQEAKQEHRLNKLLTDSDAVKDDLQEQKAETQRRMRMVRAFPRAFFFDFIGREHGLLRFDFRPNPDFSPKDRETQMYRGMEGKLWVEPMQERIVQIQGKLTRDVSFGWGIFGRLSKGGIYEITQTQLSPGKWRITKLNVDVKGRVFLSSFKFQRREGNSRFRPVPAEMTYAEALEALIAEPAAPNIDKDANPRPTRHSRDRGVQR